VLQKQLRPLGPAHHLEIALQPLAHLPGIAPLRGTTAAEIDAFRYQAFRLLCIAGLAGLPQINLPLAMLDGCPLGLSLIAARGNELLLLNLATRLARHAGR